MPNRFCENTDIVRAGASRHSYHYGQEWFEADWWASMSMCTGGVCGSQDLNEWVASAGAFINGPFRRQYELTKTTLNKKQGGLLTDKQKIVFQDAKRIMDEWDEKYGDFRPHGFWDEFKSVVPGEAYTKLVTPVIDIFDNAACMMDDLNALQPEGAVVAKPPRAGGSPPGGATSWMGLPDDADAGGGPGFGTLAMVFGIGIAGFIGYKAMTE